MLQKRRQYGFSLVELMVVVVIVAILTLVAFPSYRSFVQRSQRTEAKEALIHLANNQERFYLQNNTFSADLTQLGFSGSQTDGGLYHLDIVAADQQGFIATASPAPGSKMSDDSDCQQFGIDEDGNRTATPDPLGNCW